MQKFKSVFSEKHLKNAGYPLRVLGYFDRFGNGKCDNSPLVKPIGLKMKNVYIRGCCGGGWVGLAPSKFAILRDRGIQKWVGEDFAQVWKRVVFGSCGEWAGLGWEMFLDLVGVFCTYLEAPRSHIEKKQKTYFLLYITPDIPPRRPDII